ncbi:MAG: MarR family transcriptional regulator [Candidatus Dadabacteria bacterium]|nr:MarR family transcriptional regulator [Candidatus Dadabacteria bacterium]
MGTHYKGTKKEIRALNAYINLMRSAESITSRLSRFLGDNGLSTGQLGVLEALFHLGQMCQRELALKHLKSDGNITMVVDNLEKRGLVKRKREIEDRRFITVNLTEKGRRLINEIFPSHVSAIVKEMSILTDSEQEELRRICRKLGKREKKQQGG